MSWARSQLAASKFSARIAIYTAERAMPSARKKPPKNPPQSPAGEQPAWYVEMKARLTAEEAALRAVKDPEVGSPAWYLQVEERSDKTGELLYELYKAGKLGGQPKPSEKAAERVRQQKLAQAAQAAAMAVASPEWIEDIWADALELREWACAHYRNRGRLH
jgi:hypothetical protein